MEKDLIQFPAWGSVGYEDSGEGGLFVMLFIPEPESWNHGCHVDVAIQANNPDVLVYPRDAELWEDRGYNDPDSDWRLQQKVCDLLRDQAPKDGPNPMWHWAATARSLQDMSANMLVAMHLGSDHRALWSEHQGHYWYAQPEHLTPEGKALYDGLKAAYGVEPILATFLDT